MSESYVQLPPNSTGSKMRVIEETIGLDTVESEVVYIGGHLITGSVNLAGSIATLPVTGSADITGGTIGISGSSVTLAVGISGSTTTFAVTGSVNSTLVGASVTQAITGSMNITGGTIGLSGSSFVLPIGISGSSITFAVTGSTNATIVGASVTQAVTGSSNITGGTIGISGSSITFATGISGSSVTLAVTGSTSVVNTVAVTGSILNTVAVSGSNVGIYGGVTLTTTGSSVTLVANSGSVLVPANISLKIKVYDCGIATTTSGFKYFYFGSDTGSTQVKRIMTFGESGSIHSTFIQPRVSDTNEGLYLMSDTAATVYFDFGYARGA